MLGEDQVVSIEGASAGVVGDFEVDQGRELGEPKRGAWGEWEIGGLMLLSLVRNRQTQIGTNNWV